MDFDFNMPYSGKRPTLFHDYMLNLSGRILVSVVFEGENLNIILTFGRVGYLLNIYHTNTPYLEPGISFPHQYEEIIPTWLRFQSSRKILFHGTSHRQRIVLHIHASDHSFSLVISFIE